LAHVLVSKYCDHQPLYRQSEIYALLHTLPKGFVRIRHFGFLANRRRTALLPLCFQLLGAIPQPQVEQQASAAKEPRRLWRCPKCGGPMVVIERLTAAQLQLRSPPWLAGAAA